MRHKPRRGLTLRRSILSSGLVGISYVVTMTQLLPFTTVLRNGDPIRIREVGVQDRDLLVEGFRQLSPESRFFRFLAAHKDLSREELDRFTATNDSTHMAIGAAVLHPNAEQPVAIARYVRATPQDTEAELALTIIDSYQRLGLGTLMLETLAQAALAEGITQFNALVHADNDGMAALLHRFGATRTREGTEIEWRMPLASLRPAALAG